MDIATAHRLLGIVTDDAPYAEDNLRDGFQRVGAAEDRLASYEALVYSYDMPEHVEPTDVTREMLDGWQVTVDQLMSIIRESGNDLADARMHLERVVHYFDDREARVA